jgi:hypothetical protein
MIDFSILIVVELLVSLVLVSLHFLPSPDEKSDGTSNNQNTTDDDHDDGPNWERMSVIKHSEIVLSIYKDQVLVITVNDLFRAIELSRTKV